MKHTPSNYPPGVTGNESQITGEDDDGEQERLDRESDPGFNRPCLSWRQPGGFWCLHEDGDGDRMRLEHHLADRRLEELSDRDLMEIHDLINHAIRARRISKP